MIERSLALHVVDCLAHLIQLSDLVGVHLDVLLEEVLMVLA